MLDSAHEEWAHCVTLHTKGIETSPFREHFNERSNASYNLEKMAEAARYSAVLLEQFRDDLTPDQLVIHFYRLVRGTLEARELARSASASKETLAYVERLAGPVLRQELERLALLAEPAEKRAIAKLLDVAPAAPS